MTDEQAAMEWLERAAEAQGPSGKPLRTIKAMLTRDWQPIETAPKDETPVLLYCPEIYDHHRRYGDNHIVVGNWNVRPWLDAEGWYSDVIGELDGGGGYDPPEAKALQLRPTRWMPLPLEPSDA